MNMYKSCKIICIDILVSGVLFEYFIQELG